MRISLEMGQGDGTDLLLMSNALFGGKPGVWREILLVARERVELTLSSHQDHYSLRPDGAKVGVEEE